MDTVTHVCPVCKSEHKIAIGLHRLAYGRQLACSPRCKDALPRVARTRVLIEGAERRRALGIREDND